MALTPKQQAQYDSLINAGASKESAMGAASLVPDKAQPDTSDFTSQLQQKLLDQSGIISSDNTKLESKIADAITGVQQGAKDSAKVVASQYDRQKAVVADQGQSQMTSAQESQRGYATNTAALKQLSDNTNKQLNDLEQRKQELILQGNAAAAQQVSSLQVQAIQFHQQAQQQVFANLLGIGNYAQQSQQIKNQADQFKATMDFQSNQAISGIALKYGLSISPGETLDSITTKAMPFASQEEKLQLDQLRTQIDANRATTAKALADAKAGTTLNTAQIDALALAYNSGGQAVLAGVKDPVLQASVINRAATMQGENLVQSAHDAGDDKDTARDDIISNAALNASVKASALSALDKVYGNNPKPQQTQSNPFVGFSNFIRVNFMKEPPLKTY
jgi:hypothetical protein